MAKKNKNLLRSLLDAKPLRTPLDFGINENVRLTSITNEEKKRDGEVINKNTWMTFTKYNSKGVAVANSEFSYFNLQHDSKYIEENFSTQVSQLMNLIQLINPEEISEFNPVKDYEDAKELEADLGSKKGCKKLMNLMYDQFEEIVGDHVGPEGTLFRMKVVTEKTGKYFQLPKDAIFAESMDISLEDSSLVVSEYEKKLRSNADITPAVKPDSAGAAPGEKPSKKQVLSGL